MLYRDGNYTNRNYKYVQEELRVHLFMWSVLWHAWRRYMYTKFWSEKLKGRDHPEDLGIGGRKIFEYTLEK
jgi:hypothetical protein